MEFYQYLSIRRSNGNVHVELDGDFPPERARDLAVFLASQDLGHGNIFIHTDRLGVIDPDAPTALGRWLESVGVPISRVYAIGRRGMELASDTVKAIVPKDRRHGRRRCCEKCKTCACKGADETAAAA